MAKSQAKHHIALCSPNSGLQTSLLVKLICEETGVSCVAYTSLKDLPQKTTLLLIDCNNQSMDVLRNIAKQFQERAGDNSSGALFNAEYETEHENLLDWPCISGLFYVDTDEEQLIRGLKCLLAGDYWVPRRLLHHFMDKNRRPPSSVNRPRTKLTKREKQILQFIHEGATNQDISANLDVSEHTIKSHLYNVYKKIGVRNRMEAANWVRDLDIDLDKL